MRVIKEPREITEMKTKIDLIKTAGTIQYGAQFDGKRSYYYMEFSKGIHHLTTKGNSFQAVTDQMYDMLVERKLIREGMLCL